MTRLVAESFWSQVAQINCNKTLTPCHKKMEARAQVQIPQRANQIADSSSPTLLSPSSCSARLVSSQRLHQDATSATSLVRSGPVPHNIAQRRQTSLRCESVGPLGRINQNEIDAPRHCKVQSTTTAAGAGAGAGHNEAERSCPLASASGPAGQRLHALPIEPNPTTRAVRPLPWTTQIHLDKNTRLTTD